MKSRDVGTLFAVPVPLCFSGTGTLFPSVGYFSNCTPGVEFLSTDWN